MAKIEEMRIEKNVEEVRIENSVYLTKVYLGGGDEYIVLSGNDITIFDKFLAAGDKIISISNEMEEKIEEIKNKYKCSKEENPFSESIEIIAERKKFSDEAEKLMDGILGENSTRKFFGDVYAEIPTFVPDVECFLNFWDSLIPVIERLTGHKGKLEKLSNKKMEKYQPQDHKRKMK